jgi:hypothetical protein
MIGNQVIWQPDICQIFSLVATEKELESNSKALKYLIDQVFHSGFAYNLPINILNN